MTLKILGIAGSIRSRINRQLSELLIRNIRTIPGRQQLIEYLRILSVLPDKADLKLPENYPTTLLDLYSKILTKKKRKKGLSNSEVALIAALWEVSKRGVDIEYCALVDYFLPSQEHQDIEVLKRMVREADALLISGPVYFGDRSSLVHEFIRMCRTDHELQEHLKGKLYGGIAVGAKRNGGQETTLIYQVLDMTNLGLWAVGNDSETTSQYGGTCHAGDIGQMHIDNYGLSTSMGVGRRLANLLMMVHSAPKIRGKIKVLFIILQEGHNIAKQQIDNLIKNFSSRIEATVIDATKLHLIRCLACDVCPKKIDIDEKYRCTVGRGDDLYKIHNQMLDQDALVPVTVSLSDQHEVSSNYQIFMERMRYLRRGDYALADMMVSPLVFQELESFEYLDVRSITSLIRHQTVISKPIIGHLSSDKVLNESRVIDEFETYLDSVERLTAARLYNAQENGIISQYCPVGYVVSAEKDKEQTQLELRRNATKKRVERLKAQATSRLSK